MYPDPINNIKSNLLKYLKTDFYNILITILTLSYQLKRISVMLKKFLIPLLLLLIGCNAPKAPEAPVKTRKKVKAKTEAPKPAPSPWKVLSYPGAQGDQAPKKYIKLEADGTFSNSTVSNGYLNADIVADKANAGILLHLLKKSAPSVKFTGPVNIKMKNSAGNELEMTSTRPWNKAGGILIERNNNDYSRFRIFMLESEGTVNVVIRDETAAEYRFDLQATGFGDSFSQI